MIQLLYYFLTLSIFGLFKEIKSDECNSIDSTITCPLQNFPSYFTRCCWNNGTMTCCPDSSDFIQFDESFIMILSIIVILACLILSVLCVICCFWSPCPLYPVCRKEYSTFTQVSYNNEDYESTLPVDNNGKKKYRPIHVNIKQLDEDSNPINEKNEEVSEMLNSNNT